MTKHTPGPWQLDDELVVYDAHNSVPIGKVNDRKADAIGNAHLIAAAPELLEALKQIEALVCQRNESAVTLDTITQVYLLANAAIAKATGDA